MFLIEPPVHRYRKTLPPYDFVHAQMLVEPTAVEDNNGWKVVDAGTYKVTDPATGQVSYVPLTQFMLQYVFVE